ncbi:MAG TPA: hypothetical protein VK623_09525 [Flavobacterium sp.]|nr:hypothetical protein [Flavobacterium sp.]
MEFKFKVLLKKLLTSMREAFRWPVWKWLVTGSFGGIYTFIKFGKDAFNIEWKESVSYALLCLLILYTFRVTLLFSAKFLEYYHDVSKNSVYGEAIIILKDSFALAHSYRKLGVYDDKEFMIIMITFCNDLQRIFELIIKGECSVSIKIPMHAKTVTEHTVLSNLTRDVKNKGRSTVQYENIKHTLIGNTAFSYALNKVVINSKDKFYLNNEVNDTKNYSNTSKECYADGVLPYNSELVMPIVPVYNEKNPTKFDCHGFICIDSSKKKAFGSKYEVAILEGVADGIYDIMSQRNNNVVDNLKA